MQSLPSNVYSVATVREVDRRAINAAGIPGYTLMSRAAGAAVREARQRFPQAKRWQVICGAGNNGGDGYAVARLAANDGIVVSVLAVVDPETLQGDAATAYGDFAAEGGVVLPWSGELDSEAELLVDGLLGNGLTRDIGGELAAAVAATNAHPAPVMALDIPTGIHGDTGSVMGCAVVADVTVTFVGLKTGLFLDRGAGHCGDIVLSTLDIPTSCYPEGEGGFRRITDAMLAAGLPPRSKGAHKGDFGHVLVIGGDAGMPGAVQLCGEGALRAGAGRVSIATHPQHAASVSTHRPELMSQPISSSEDLRKLIDIADVIAFGPGLGQSSWAEEMVSVVAADQRPAVWDADALNWLARTPDTAPHRVITPHPGEAGRLLGRTTAEVQADRSAALTDLQSQYGGIVVLKGAGTLVSSAAGLPWLCSSGNPGMAAPGMGDVLTGIIAALIAQGLGAEEAAAVGVEVHARAGDRAAEGGQRGLLAGELLQELRSIVNP
jgi:hydroxyethylthiazole kinase-like uncharacterized protein yjeF